MPNQIYLKKLTPDERILSQAMINLNCTSIKKFEKLSTDQHFMIVRHLMATVGMYKNEVNLK